MNEKLCKKLRRIARIQTVGKPGRRLIKGEVQAYDKKTGKPYKATVALNDPITTRGTYRAFKKQARAAIERARS